MYGLSITTTGAPVVPLYISGQLTMTDVSIGSAVNCLGGLATIMNGCSRVQIDSINNIGLNRRISLLDAHDVQIANVITDGTSSDYSKLVLVDWR